MITYENRQEKIAVGHYLDLKGKDRFLCISTGRLCLSCLSRNLNVAANFVRGISWFHFVQCGIAQRGGARHDLFKGCFTTYNRHYYSFNIFPRIWLVKTTRIIHHNQPLLTKFEKNFVMLNRWRQNDVKSAALLQLLNCWPRKPGDEVELFW